MNIFIRIVIQLILLLGTYFQLIETCLDITIKNFLCFVICSLFLTVSTKEFYKEIKANK